MAIHGSTTAFPVRGLLEFVAATRRTGRLVLHTEPRTGLVAFRAGRLVAAALGGTDETPTLVTPTDLTTVGELLADLVSLPGGRFAFHPDGVEGDDTGFDLLDALAVARALEDADGDGLASDVPLRLTSEPTFTAVTVPEDQWEVLARLGEGATIDELAEELGLGRATVRRRAEGLLRLGLAELAASTAASA